MIVRATSADFISAVANHPDVRPFVHAKDSKPIDLTDAVRNPNNIVLTGDYGGMVMVQAIPGVYELHTMVLPEGRGPWAIKMAQACMDYLFSRTNANEVFTRVPLSNLAAKALAVSCGAKIEHLAMQNLNGTLERVAIYGGTIHDWIRTAPDLIERGRAFHEDLEAKARAAGIKAGDHPQDDWHDRHVGAAVGMVLGGQPVKGLLFFNRWASMAMAPQMKLVSTDPLTFDITDCYLVVRDNDFEVTQCLSESLPPVSAASRKPGSALH